MGYIVRTTSALNLVEEKKMSGKNIGFALGLTGLSILGQVSSAQALTWTIGNSNQSGVVS